MRETSSSPSPKLSSKKRPSERVVLNRARLTGSSCTSFVCDSSSVCVGCRSEAVLKSRSSRLRKTLRVLGAESVVLVRRRMAWRRTWPVKLENGGRQSSGFPPGNFIIPGKGSEEGTYGTNISSCSSASLASSGSGSKRWAHVFCSTEAPERGVASFSVLTPEKSTCSYSRDCSAGVMSSLWSCTWSPWSWPPWPPCSSWQWCDISPFATLVSVSCVLLRAVVGGVCNVCCAAGRSNGGGGAKQSSDALHAPCHGFLVRYV